MEEDKKEKKGRIYRLMLDGARAVRARPTRKFERHDARVLLFL